MKTGTRIFILSFVTILFFTAGCKGRKNRCATCPTWSYEKIDGNSTEAKG